MQPKEFARTVVGNDYLKTKKSGNETPHFNCFLDFMNVLKAMKSTGEYPSTWIDTEIEAIKIILAIETRHMA